MKNTLLLVATILSLAFAQQYLPKEGYLPITDTFSANIARSGDNDFYKVNENKYSTLISSYPVRPNAITKVTFLMVQGTRFVFGCGQGYMSNVLSGPYVGSSVLPNTVGYYNEEGTKWRNS